MKNQNAHIYIIYILIIILILTACSLLCFLVKPQPICYTSQLYSFNKASDSFDPEFIYIVRIVDLNFIVHDYEYDNDYFEAAEALYSYFFRRSSLYLSN